MNDTNNKLGQRIIKVLFEQEKLGVSSIYKELSLADVVPLISIKREVSRLTSRGFLYREGKGRSVKYSLSFMGRFNAVIDVDAYCSVDAPQRYGRDSFDINFFESLSDSVFFDKEIRILEEATEEYRRKNHNVSETLRKKELERFIIEMSWKSSKIEGNTYTLLDTEKLIKEGVEAPGKSKDEAAMILNHKIAFDFIYKNRKLFEDITVSKIEDIHKIIVKDLKVTNNLRFKPVGVLGSKYKPLDNQFQIREAIEKLCAAVRRMKDPYSKSLMMIMGISYIQPFEDGNKRTARLLGNAILLAYHAAPLSYRIVSEEDYREATLVFYELNTIVPFKNIFMEQYIYSTKNYLDV